MRNHFTKYSKIRSNIENNMIENPFIKESAIVYQREISKDLLIKGYKEQFNIDIEPLLSSADRISVYKCQKSGYCFYYPFEIAGDSSFYEKLQEGESYYMSWKWEHQVCNKFINEGSKLLEIGCGRGDFIRKISSQYENIYCVGLELNKKAAASDERFKILNLSIENFSRNNQGIFDIVCSFQVLEHIPEVNSFLKASIKCLRDDGLLVISVPNNNSYIKYGKSSILNMPPHHMGLWTDESLKRIGEYYNLELVEIAYEPLQPYHFDTYLYLILRRFTGRYPTAIILFAIKFLKLRNIINKLLRARAHKIKGHSVLVVFKNALT